MRPSRLSLASLAVCVLILALDFAILRHFPGNDRKWLNLFALPMLNILAFAFYRGYELRRFGASSPFLFGFQLLGWAAMIFYLAVCRIRPQGVSWAIAQAFHWVGDIVLENLDFDTMKRLDPTFRVAHRIMLAIEGGIVAFVLTAIMLLIALSGGIIARRTCRATGNAKVLP